MTPNKQFNLLSIIILLIAISVGFYYGLNDDRTTAVNHNFAPVVQSTEYKGDMVGAWAYGANALSPSRFSGMGYGYVRNDTGWLYLMGGDTSGSGTNTNRNERYNLNTNTWEVMAPMLSHLQYFGAARLKDSLYTIGGMLSGFFTASISNVRKYDINANTWVERAPLPTPIGWCESVGYQDSIIYAVGGLVNWGSTAGSRVFVYNSFNNTWREGTNLPEQKVGGALGVRGDTLVYVGGSSDYFEPPDSVVFEGIISQGDRANIIWTTGPNPKPGSSKWRFDFHDWGCKGLILTMGYSSGFGLSTEVYVYSPGSNLWTQQPNALTATSTSQSGSFALSGGVHKLVCISGLMIVPPFSIPQNQIFTDTLCLDPVGVIQHGVEIPNNYSLSQNYPNPFNPATTITFALPKAENVKLVVYDISGRAVATLVNETKQAGIYEVPLDASRFSSGVYFYRLETSSFTGTKKMLLVK